MKTQIAACVFALSLMPPIASPAFAQAGIAMGGAQAVSPPGLLPALRVAHAGQGMVLASARAGKRIITVGDHGIILLSDDDGKSFRQARVVPADSTLTGTSFADERNGWAVGHWGVILHTIDGGETWSVQRSDVTTDRPLFAVHFFDAQHGVAVGLWSLVLATDDGGASWNTVQMPAPEGAKKADLNLWGLFVDARGRAYAVAEKGMLLRSADQGKSWAYLPTSYKGSFWTGLAAKDGVLIAAGLRGSLYRSIDDGHTWTRIDTGSKSSITALAQVGAEIVGVGLDGLVLRSSDGGASFVATTQGDRQSLTSVVATNDGRAALFSRQGAPGSGDYSRK